MIISKHERRAFVMLHRRLARPVILTSFLALLCYYWVVYRSEFVSLIPRTISTECSAAQVPRSRIAKVTVATNTLNTSLIQDALRTHQVQNELHGYGHFITTAGLVSDLSENDSQHRPKGAWSKPAYLLSLIVMELTKPESERLEWLFWFDADTLVLNPHTPLEIFLPPPNNPSLSNIHLLMASNWDGLNSGAFALRVHPWSVSILSAILAYPIYQEEKLLTDRFRDQSAFQWLLQAHDSPLITHGGLGGTENWANIPMRWFNSLPVNNAFSRKWDWIFNHNMTGSLFDNGTNEVYNDGNGKRVQPWKVMQGDMVVHFAGTTDVRESWMGPWLARAKSYLPEWSNVTTQEVLREEARGFWDMTAGRMDMARKHLKMLNEAKMGMEKDEKNGGKNVVKGIHRPKGKPSKVPVVNDPKLNLMEPTATRAPKPEVVDVEMEEHVVEILTVVTVRGPVAAATGFQQYGTRNIPAAGP